VPKNSIYKGRIGPGWHNRGSPRTYNRNRGTRSAWTMPKRACSGHQRLHALRALRKVPRLRCPPSSNMWPWTHGPRKKKKQDYGLFFPKASSNATESAPITETPRTAGFRLRSASRTKIPRWMGLGGTLGLVLRSK
jgi:hypothetical protein